MKPIRTEKDLDTMRRTVAAYSALCAWAGKGLFATLSDRQPRNAVELGVHPRSLEITGMALQHLGLVNRAGEQWSLSATGAALYNQGALNASTAEVFFGPYTQMDRIMETGIAGQTTEGGVVEDDEDRARGFMDMLYRRSAISVVEMSRALSPFLHSKAHWLDVGGGHGRYGEALRDQGGVDVTLFDRSVCVNIARERYGDTQSYIAGDFMTDPLGGPYDGALLSNIVHGLGYEENRTLFERLSGAIRPGGRMVLKDMFFGDVGSQPEEAAMFGMTMLMFTREGRSYSLSEMSQLCQETGFGTPQVLALPDCGFTLLVAERLT